MLQEVMQEIEETSRAVTDQIHTALPGKIISYELGFASVKPYGKFLTSDGKELDYPVLTDVPVLFPFSGVANVGIFFPVKIGDDCLVIISEVELDAWRSEADSEASLRFDLTSAICIPGLMKKSNGLSKYASDNNAVVLVSGNTVLRVQDSKISLTGNLEVIGDITCSGTIKSR